MIANIIWLAAIALEILLLVRGLLSGLIRRYSLFYVYVGGTAAAEVLRFICYHLKPEDYAAFYWNSELVLNLLSYGVLVELFRHSFVHSAGLASFVKRILAVLLAVAIVFAAVDFSQGRITSLSRVAADLGRYLRYIEAFLLLLLLSVFARYRRSDRKLIGLAAGYGFWIAANIASLTALSLPANEGAEVLRSVLPVLYLVVLATWSVTLWSAAPSQESTVIRKEYRNAASQVKEALVHESTRARGLWQ